jgi:hypothetical protein
MGASPEHVLDDVVLTHRKLVAAAIRVYQLLGHEIAEVTGFDAEHTDLKIQSNQDELWIIRCDTSESIDAESIMAFIVSCSLEGPQQLAIITTGHFEPEAIEYVEGHPIYLVDQPTLNEYLERAEQLHIEQALTPVTIPDEVGVEMDEPPAESPSGPHTKHCPHCDGENLAGAILCDYCDRNLVVTAPLSMDGRAPSEAAEPMFAATQPLTNPVSD